MIEGAGKCAAPEEVVDRGEEAFKLKNLLHKPFHGYHFAPAVDIVPHLEASLTNADNKPTYAVISNETKRRPVDYRKKTGCQYLYFFFLMQSKNLYLFPYFSLFLSITCLVRCSYDSYSSIESPLGRYNIV